MKKWIVIGCVVLAGLVFGARNWDKWRPQEASASQRSSRPTQSVVERRDINFKVSAAGEIGPAEQVSVRPEINGRINSLPVDVGDKVAKGQVLFTLDDSDLTIERASRVIELEGAKLQFDKAKRNYLRSQELFEAKLVSQEIFEDTKTEFELSKNNVERAEKSLRLVEDRLNKTKIVAPFDCTVLTRPVSEGQAVSGSGGFNSGTEVLTIADLNSMIVNAHINQADVTRLSAGQEVDIQVESVPGLTMTGVVERIAPQAILKNSIKGYPARIRITNIDPRVRPGMTANLSIPVASAPEAVAVPLAAVFTEQGERFVYVREGNTLVKRPVRIGIADYDFAEVQYGLNPGEIVSLEDPSGRMSGAGTGRGGSGGLGGSSANGQSSGSGAQTKTAGSTSGNRSSGSATSSSTQKPASTAPATNTKAGAASQQ